MKLTHCLAAACAATVLHTSSIAGAQTPAYPTHPVNLVVPFSAGGPTDAMARILAQKLGERLGQQVIVDNRGGAGGSIAAELVARSKADGYTLFFGTTGTMAINPSLYANLRYDPIRDFAPISLMATTMNVLVVNRQLPVKTLGDLVKLAKAKPDELTYGSAGNGSSNHLSGELFRTTADIRINHIPYKGSAPALVDLLAGRISMMFDTIAQQTQNIEAGKVTALAVTGPARSPLLPEVPTAQQAGLDGFDVTIWYGVLAPHGTPETIVNRLQQEIADIMATDDMKARMQKDGAAAQSTTSAEFADLIKNDTAKWAPVVKNSGASLN
ncbi:Bug family tripartite tricarboxylate transporter substrate binding protein [Advenella mimigardefordensis]|uniref:Putative Bug-like extracytoplasmic solute binding receptor, TTT family n=1 Tax=Advenella mimigardefordensis (strain DSM 17166 / LMG 22922 / DPN7) TaxID=1247726 RepID=W0PCR7_ADVMD|nr:tripartite tricarboxylate transporter substrate binding protein [Advenella mimigardefordensis]AHG64551.1 putative Bug-like extracytoplasmic solute binding receptor, TTT family [Advenella mimigardefordensis DPN7]